MNKNIIVVCAILLHTVSSLTYGAQRYYVPNLPNDSIVKEKCQACTSSGIFGLFQSAEYKACQNLEQVFQDKADEVKYKENFLRAVFRGFYSGFGIVASNYHLVHQEELLRNAIRTIMSSHPDEQKYKELAYCQELLKKVPQLKEERRKAERNAWAEKIREERRRF